MLPVLSTRSTISGVGGISGVLTVFWILKVVPGFWDWLTEAGETPGVVARARLTRAETSPMDQRMMQSLMRAYNRSMKM
jgi:hypothetical protein